METVKESWIRIKELTEKIRKLEIERNEILNSELFSWKSKPSKLLLTNGDLEELINLLIAYRWNITWGNIFANALIDKIRQLTRDKPSI